MKEYFKGRSVPTTPTTITINNISSEGMNVISIPIGLWDVNSWGEFKYGAIPLTWDERNWDEVIYFE